MNWANDKELLVDLISYASIVSAAIFGMIGLFTDYKKDGKTTPWGHLAAGGIALSAMLAMTSAVLQKQISSDERAAGERRAREQRALEKAQFDAQIGQLLGLNRQMSGVNRANTILMSDMRRSLGAQQVQLASARRNLLLTAGLRDQQQANTFRLLETMWVDANRVPLEGVVLFVRLLCIVPGDTTIPIVFGEHAEARIAIAPLAAVTRLIPDLAVFSPRSLIEEQREIEEEVSQIASVDQRIVSDQQENISSHLIRFSSFMPRGPWRHGDAASWRQAAIEVIVTNPDEPWAREIVGSLGDTSEWTIDGAPIIPQPRLPPASSGPRPATLPCTVVGQLGLNGRLIDLGIGHLVRADVWDSTVLVIRFGIVRSDPMLFPIFAAGGSN